MTLTKVGHVPHGGVDRRLAPLRLLIISCQPLGPHRSCATASYRHWDSARAGCSRAPPHGDGDDPEPRGASRAVARKLLVDRGLSRRESGERDAAWRARPLPGRQDPRIRRHRRACRSGDRLHGEMGAHPHNHRWMAGDETSGTESQRDDALCRRRSASRERRGGEPGRHGERTPAHTGVASSDRHRNRHASVR